MATTARITHSLLTALTYLLPCRTRRIARAAVAIGSMATPTATIAPKHRSFRLTLPKPASKPATTITYPVTYPLIPVLIQQLQARMAKLEADARVAARARQHAPAPTTPAAPTLPAPTVDTHAEDAVLALQSLGITKQQARVLVGAARVGHPAADTAALVRLALPQCGGVQAPRFNSKKD